MIGEVGGDRVEIAAGSAGVSISLDQAAAAWSSLGRLMEDPS